jgi:hypothetical protein
MRAATAIYEHPEVEASAADKSRAAVTLSVITFTAASVAAGYKFLSS